MVLEE